MMIEGKDAQRTKVASNLTRIGPIAFWSQLVLGIISAVTLLFATPILFSSQERTQGIEFGLLCALCALILLSIAIYLSFRYRKYGLLLQNPNATIRPKKTDIFNLIRLILILNLTGTLLAIIGAEALVGIVLAKSLTLPQVTLGSNPKQFVNSVDLLVIQANTNTISAHFAGIVTSLWLLSGINKN